MFQFRCLLSWHSMSLLSLHFPTAPPDLGQIPLMQALRGRCGPPGIHGTVDTQDTLRLGHHGILVSRP